MATKEEQIERIHVLEDAIRELAKYAIRTKDIGCEAWLAWCEEAWHAVLEEWADTDTANPAGQPRIPYETLADLATFRIAMQPVWEDGRIEWRVRE